MKTISSPLRTPEHGETVTNLHQALRALDLQIANDELRDSFFGETTVSAVLRFQHSMHIDGRGDVDEATAAALNRTLREKGLLEKEFRVSGRVVDPVGAPVVMQDVHVFDVDLRGVGIIDKLRGLGELLQTPGFQWLGTTTTNADGFYSIGFDREQFIFADKSHADVLAFVVQDGLLVEHSRLVSKRDYSTETEVNGVDIQLKDTLLLSGISEWDRLLGAIDPILNMSEITLPEIAGSTDQINFLAQETDFALEQLELAVKASALAQNHLDRDDAELLYALGRQQVGLTLIEINDVTDSVLLAHLKQAIRLNIISAKSDERLESFLARLLTAAAADIISPDNQVPEIQVLNRSLDAAALQSANAKFAFLSAAQQFNGADPAQFWSVNLPQAGLDTIQIDALKLTNQLYALSSGHTPFIEHLQMQRGIQSPQALLSLNDQDWLDTINISGVPADYANAGEYISHIRNTLHAAFPTATIARMVNTQAFTSLNDLQRPVADFFAQATSFDIASHRVEDFTDIIAGVATGQTVEVRDTLQTLQRVFQISPTPAAMSQLLSAGIRSSFQVAIMPQAAFVKQFATTLGGEDLALSVHNRASYISMQTLNTVITSREYNDMNLPAGIAIDNKTAFGATIKHIPNYETLFNNTSLCECRDCRSVNSPAAYLVDLLRFLDNLKKNSAGITPYDVLEHRRPDLIHLQLTCENTNTVIPYIDLVNEVLEYYVANAKLDANAIHNNSAETPAELRANPQYVSPDAYKKLATAVFPFTLPYHQPLDTLRAFLPAKLTRAGLMHAFGIQGAAVVAESLGLSGQEYALLSKEAFDASPDLTELWTFYGYADAAAMHLSLPNVPELLNRAGISYRDLVALLKTRFLNPGQIPLDIVDDIFKTPVATGQPAQFDSQQVYDILRDIHDDLLLPDDNAAVKDALNRHGIINTAGFVTWIKANLAAINSTVLLFEPESHCDLNTTTLRSVEQLYNAAPTPLAEDFLSKLHRFIRLWRKSGWTIAELDTALLALQITDFSASALIKIADFKALADSTHIPLEKLATLFGVIETLGEKSLYAKLFQNRTIQQLDNAFTADAFGNLLAADTPIANHKPAILAAFKIKDEELSAIAVDAGIDLADPNTFLKLPTLSVLYRYVVLANALKLKVTELISAKTLLGINPFADFDQATNLFAEPNPDISLTFIQEMSRFQQSDFKISELEAVLSGTAMGLSDAQIHQTLIGVHTDWAKIEFDHPPVSNDVEVSETFLSQKLELIYPVEPVDLLFATLNNTAIFQVSTTANLNLVIPASLINKFKYNNAKGLLTAVGVLTAEQRTLIQAFSPSPAYKNAVKDLYELPGRQLAAAFSQFLSPLSAENLLDAYRTEPANPEVSSERQQQKRSEFYRLFLPVLKKQLRETAIYAHFGNVLGISEAQTAAVLQGTITDVPSQHTLAQDLVDAFKAQGFRGDYFDNMEFTGPAIGTRIDPTVDFVKNNSFNIKNLPLNNFGCRWTAQIGTAATEERILVVNVAGTDDRFQLFINDTLLLEKIDGDNQTHKEVAVAFEKDRLYQFRLDYTDRSRASGIRLSWKTEFSTEEVFPATAAIPNNVVEQLSSILQGLYRGSLLVQKFPLSLAEIQYILTHLDDFAQADFQNPSLLTWQSINDYAELRKLAPQSDWLAVLAAAHKPANTVDQLIAEVLTNKSTGWTVDNLRFVSQSHFGFGVAGLTTPSNWLAVAKLCRLATEQGFSAERLKAWAEPVSDFVAINALAIDVQNAIRSKYTDKDWAEFAPTVTNGLRERRRDALVSYLLVQDSLKKWGVIDADSLFEHFLIDVQMSACMDTSRVRQALSSVQLFVTRCLLNLEREQPGHGDFWVAPDQIAAAEWEWMKLYRVWEANRKVFIYPENWLEPEWRDDRSPFFKELESELTQNDITAFSVETAFRNYLGKLDSVSNLEVVGVYHDKGSNTLHVVARSHGIAAQYFYRNRNDAGRWSAWENLPVDVKTAGEGANNGAHILPRIWKGRLFVFWLEFLQKSVLPDVSKTGASEGSIAGISELQAQKQWLVHLCFVEYRDDKWQPKQMSKDTLQSFAFTDDEAPDYSPQDYRPSMSESNGKLIIGIESFGPARNKQTTRKNEVNVTAFKRAGAFELTNPQAEIKVIDIPSLRSFFQLPKDINQFMARTYNNGLNLRKSMYLDAASSRTAVIFSHDMPASTFEADASIPFFFRDAKRNFYVEPKDKWIPLLFLDIVKKPELVPFLPYVATLQKVQIAPDLSVAQAIKPSSISRLQTVQLAEQPGANIGVASKTATSNALFSTVATAASAFGGKSLFRVPDQPPSGFMTKALTFHNFYHPYSETFIDQLNRFGVTGLLNQDTSLNSDEGAAFKTEYQPSALLVNTPYPPVKVEFDENEAYSLYNWELFFHAPLYIATRLTKNGKYAEAMQWYHYIFNPMTAEKPDPKNRHYWQVPPFKLDTIETIDAFFDRLAKGKATEDDNKKLDEWREHPFKPHLIARGRPVAYMKNVVMRYIENLVAWGDDLFRRDTIESINEATQLYIIAAHILGKRPESIPARGKVAPETYASLRGKLDDFGNALVALENLFPNASAMPVSSAAAIAANGSLLGLGTALYFCIPQNAKLLTYWDTVEDRLFKIRHCLNLDGVERKLALFDPPIDPAMLVAATAAGVSLGNVLSDLFSPSPLHRFQFLLEKSLELTAEVREMGHFLLSVLEKKDAAGLALLQSGHATHILEMTEDIRTWHILEAKANRDVLMKARDVSLERLGHQLDLMDIQLGGEGVNIPAPAEFNAGKKPSEDDSLPADTLIGGQEAMKTPATRQKPVASGESGPKLLPAEKLVQEAKEAVQTIQKIIAVGKTIGGALSALPQFDTAAKPWGVGAGINIGGAQFSTVTEFANKLQEVYVALKSLDSEKSGTTAEAIRREQQWSIDARLAVREILQIHRQIIAADIRIAMAQRELAAHRQQIKNAEEVEDFLKTRFTNVEQYTWLRERIFSAHKTAYQLAYDLAKTAERAYRTEVGNNTSNIIQYGYFDGSHQGLLAGEQLAVALRQLEKAYLDGQKRQFELTKNISLTKIDEPALGRLRATGACDIHLTEQGFDRDFPGHYYRRIRSVSISIPCNADATTTVAATLRLLSNSIRLNTSGAIYERNQEDGVDVDDERFAENNVPCKAIAVSHGKNDSGLFELNFDDARYLPFEGAGVISRWRLEMNGSAALRASVTDVILGSPYKSMQVVIFIDF